MKENTAKNDNSGNLNIKTLILQKKDSMTKSQQYLADYIIENIDDVAFQTYSEISAKSGVSEASFIRFLRSIGFESFADFKQVLRENFASRVPPGIRMKEAIEKIEKKENIYKNMLSIDREMLQEVEDNWSEEKIEKAGAMIRNARRIYIAGFGISRGIADFLEFRFNRLGYPGVLITRGGSDVVEKLLGSDSRDVIIVIGFSMPHKEMGVIYRIASERKIPVIAITDSYSSPLRKGADIVLHARRGPTDYITSLAAPMAVTNILTLVIAFEDREKTFSSFSRLEEMKKKYI